MSQLFASGKPLKDRCPKDEKKKRKLLMDNDDGSDDICAALTCIMPTGKSEMNT